MHLPYQTIVELGQRLIQPFNEELVNPASYDITLDDNAIYRGERIKLPFDLPPGEFILVTSQQYWSFPCDLSGQLLLKSSIGRSGIDHMLAGWFDPDFHGNATMELKNDGHLPFRLYKGQRVAQMVFLQLSAPTDKPYRIGGRYHGQRDVTAVREEVGSSGISESIQSSPLWISGDRSDDFYRYSYSQWIRKMAELGLTVEDRNGNQLV